MAPVSWVAKRFKALPTDVEKRRSLELSYGPNVYLLPRIAQQQLYDKLIMTTKEYETTKGKLTAYRAMRMFLASRIEDKPLTDNEAFSRNEALKKLERSAHKTVGLLQDTLQSYNTLQLSEMSVSHPNQVLAKVYKATQKHGKLATGGQAGTYRHLTKAANTKIFEAMKANSGFGESSVLIDFGSGLMVPCMHASATYGCKSIGIEVDKELCMLSARSIQEVLQFESAISDGKVQGSVALIRADFTSLKPITGATHAYLFDLCFPPKVYASLLSLIAASSFRYVVTFKPMREKSYLKDTLRILDAVVVCTIKDLKFSGRGSCSALLLERQNPPLIPAIISEPSCCSGMVDSMNLIKPFFVGPLPARLSLFDAFKLK